MKFADIVSSISQFQAAFESLENGTPTLDDAKTVNAVYGNFKAYFDNAISAANAVIASNDAIAKLKDSIS